MYMASIFLFPCLFFFLCSTISLSTPNSIKDGFAVPLIHCDSPQSPFYNHSMTTYDRNLAAAHRSVSRLNHLSWRSRQASKSNAPDITTRVVYNSLEYIMEFFIGTPPSKLTVFADTGSDFIWAKCQMCEKCPLSPIFEPLRSFTYQNFACGAQPCRDLGLKGRTRCTNDTGPCMYELKYRDGASTRGILSSEKFSIQAIGVLEDIGSLYFGCSNNYSDQFIGLQNGCVGLNRGQFSLITQLGIKKFSHCFVLPEYESRASSMLFGSVAKLYGDETPFKGSNRNHYFVTLEAISVGDQMISVPSGGYGGGLMVDTGTSYTFLTSETFEQVLHLMHQVVHLPQQSGPIPLELCYKAKLEDFYDVPFVTFHLTGVDLRLMKQSTFVEVSKGLWCFAFLRSPDPYSVFGSYQQRDFWVGYDIEREVMSFAPADCGTV